MKTDIPFPGDGYGGLLRPAFSFYIAFFGAVWYTFDRKSSTQPMAEGGPHAALHHRTAGQRKIRNDPAGTEECP
ncbi:MAG: hypothetical protein IKV57_05380, partial [Clostridia bacterium]|nr:hypothetical protein [Clostridia bacterium]